jgi:hypothetical protein
MKSGEDIDRSGEFGEMLERPQLMKFLYGFNSGISYIPIRNEPNPLKLFPELMSKIHYTIQPNPSLNPAAEVEKVLKEVSGSVFILIPGTAFDALGTRYGKGAGWYDRFLSIAPKDWLRVGVCYSKQFSETPLLRQRWDEPMDLVCVTDKDSGILTTWQNPRSVS